MQISPAQLLADAEAGIEAYLTQAREAGLIDAQLAQAAAAATGPNLRQWLESPDIDRISPNARQGIAEAVEARRWEQIVNAYRRDLGFGTGGIRGMMAFDRPSIERMAEEGIDAPILKGPNTLNNLVLLRVSAGVAKFGNNNDLSKIVIGYDSRVRGADFACAIAELFLAFGFTVFMFDAPCPYPEVTFAIPDDQIKADLGILISASHNDYRYNGYKLSSANGSQFDPQQRDDMYNNYIKKATFADVKTCPIDEAPDGRLIYLGGDAKLDGVDYAGRPMLNIHDRHKQHILSFMVGPAMLGERYAAAAEQLRIGYCAFHGAGRIAVPRLFTAAGFTNYKPITVDGLNDLNGLFPSFCSDPGKEQQPDPGDPRAGSVAVKAFNKQYPGEFEKLDVLIGTDPDADRCGVIVKVPADQQHIYDGRDYVLLTADDLWALVIWYRLQAEIQLHGRVVDADKKFIALSATTSDSIVRTARKHGLGAVVTWVGFANLAAAVRMIWDKEQLPDLTEGRTSIQQPLCHPFVCRFFDMSSGQRSFNYAAMEQSNGFSLLGDPPPDARSLGAGGHVRDKDGIFAALLVADIAAYAKANDTTLFEMIDRHIYLDPDVGLFVNFYEPDPLDGEYPGIEGDRKKLAILRRTLALFQLARAGSLHVGPFDVVDATLYRTGKYDHIYPPTFDFEFPDEGVRLFFCADLLSHVTIRPSGTGNSLRFHVQLHADVNESNLIAEKQRLRTEAAQVLDDLRKKLEAPRNNV